MFFLDASNGIDCKKLYPLVISFFDENKGFVCVTVLSLLESTDNRKEDFLN